jgi:hypothetical protein
MKKLVGVLKRQQGSVMVMALMIFLIISVLATSIISVAAMESKMTLYDARKEQARQLADAGVQVARNVVMNYMGNGRLMNAAEKNNDISYINSKLEVLESRNIDAEITDVDYNSRIVRIKSTGTVKNPGGSDVKKTAQADLLLNVLPDMAVQTEEFKILGKYYTEFQLNPITPGGGVTGLLPLHGPSHEKCSDLGGANPNRYFWYVDYKYESILGIPYVDWIETRAHTIPYMKAQGKVNIRDSEGGKARVAIDHWAEVPEASLTPEEYADLFYTIPTIEESMLNAVNVLLRVEYHEPARNLNTYDFIGDLDEVLTGAKPPVFGATELQRYRQLAQAEAADPNGRWAYLPADAAVLNNDGGKHVLILDEIINPSNPNYIDRPYIFADLDPDDTLLLDFRTYKSSDIKIPDGIFIKWSVLEPFFNDINNRLQTFLNQFSNELQGITIVTPASMEAGYDSMVFKPAAIDGEATSVALFSGKDISLKVDPKLFNNSQRIFPDSDPDNPSREIRVYLLAGDNVNISSTTRELTIKGVISAGKKVTVKLDYYDLVKVTEMDKLIHIVYDPSVIKEFPDPWAYMGLGTIVSYKYTD